MVLFFFDATSSSVEVATQDFSRGTRSYKALIESVPTFHEGVSIMLVQPNSALKVAGRVPWGPVRRGLTSIKLNRFFMRL